jgi:hypothetical protein
MIVDGAYTAAGAVAGQPRLTNDDHGGEVDPAHVGSRAFRSRPFGDAYR